MHEQACARHAVATFLIDNPRNWTMSDAGRLRMARRMLVTSVRASCLAIRHAEQNNVDRLDRGVWADASTLNRMARLPTWLLFRNLLDAHARLGQRDEFEQTVAQFTRAVEAQCNLSGTARNRNPAFKQGHRRAGSCDSTCKSNWPPSSPH